VPESTIVAADALAYHVAIALMLDDRDRLARYGNKLVVFGGQFHDMLIDRLLGEVAIAQGHWGSARTYLQRAETAAREERLPWELARTLEAQAAAIAHAQQDQGTSARALAAEALQLYEQLGNQREASRLRERLAAPGTSANRRMLPAALTRREAEVLRLIATGLSNRDIADRLSLSEKTVEKHLTSAYGKIGADNRAAASAFAVRHGLA
jgi:DNA-binding CsgD family transcriptional regulator